jgi:ubiquitin-like protein Nedd8
LNNAKTDHSIEFQPTSPLPISASHDHRLQQQIQSQQQIESQQIQQQLYFGVQNNNTNNNFNSVYQQTTLQNAQPLTIMPIIHQPMSQIQSIQIPMQFQGISQQQQQPPTTTTSSSSSQTMNSTNDNVMNSNPVPPIGHVPHKSNSIIMLSQRLKRKTEEMEADSPNSRMESDDVGSVSNKIKKMKLDQLQNPSVSTRIRIQVKTLSGKQLGFEVSSEDTVYDVKKLVEEIEGVPPHQQRLIFAGKALSDDADLAHYRIVQGSILHLVLSLRGGSNQLR